MSRSLELGVCAAAVPAWLSLLTALRDLEDRGVRTPCGRWPDAFTSEDYRERAEAAEACAWCPLLPPCARFAEANDERFHVWAGVDRTPRPRGRTAA